MLSKKRQITLEKPVDYRQNTSTKSITNIELPLF